MHSTLVEQIITPTCTECLLCSKQWARHFRISKIMYPESKSPFKKGRRPPAVQDKPDWANTDTSSPAVYRGEGLICRTLYDGLGLGILGPSSKARSAPPPLLHPPWFRLVPSCTESLSRRVRLLHTLPVPAWGPVTTAPAQNPWHRHSAFILNKHQCQYRCFIYLCSEFLTSTTLGKYLMQFKLQKY